MQELRIVLIVGGLLAIAALLCHGFWTHRKQNQIKFKKAPLTNVDTSEVRAKSGKKGSQATIELPEEVEQPNDLDLSESTQAAGLISSLKNRDKKEEVIPSITTEFLDDADISLSKKTIKPTSETVDVESHEVTLQEAPAKNHQATIKSDSQLDISEPEAFSEPMVSVDHTVLGYDTALGDDTDLGNDTALISDTALTDEIASADHIQQPEAKTKESPKDEAPFEVIVLHVHAKESQALNGVELFDSMRRNGLVFGEMDIFHRHVDLHGAGKVLFSVANIMQPGTFGCDNAESFSTLGLSFFMTLPSYGRSDLNFKMMLETAENIANDMDAIVMDEVRQPLTLDKIEFIQNKIADFTEVEMA
ncbi:cell division protein ZipA [Vibrio sp.]|nr:cell division protein ZipA [Vibrio sp.]